MTDLELLSYCYNKNNCDTCTYRAECMIYYKKLGEAPNDTLEEAIKLSTYCLNN